MEEGSSAYQEVVVLQQEGRYEEALKVLQRGVEEKDGKCAWYLGYLYDMGVWVEPDEDMAKMFYNLSKDWGYERGIVKASEYDNRLTATRLDFIGISEPGAKLMLLMGYNYFNRFAVPFEVSESDITAQNDPFLYFLYYKAIYNNAIRNEDPIKFLRKAAFEMGFAEAQYVYHLCIINFKLLRQAATQGLDSAIYDLGKLLLGMRRYVPAQYWLEKLKLKRRYYRSAQSLIEGNRDIFLKIDHCRSAMMTLLAIRKLRQTDLSVLPKDVAILLAKTLWKTWEDNDWDHCKENPKKIKK